MKFLSIVAVLLLASFSHAQQITQNLPNLHDRVRAELLPTAVVGRMSNEEYRIHSALYLARVNDRRFGTLGTMTVAKWEAEQRRFIATELNKIGVRSRLVNNVGVQVNAATRQLTAAVLAQAENVVRIERKGIAFGTGTYLGDGLVLTCGHLWAKKWEGRGSIRVNVLFVDGRTISGIPIKVDHIWDQGLVQLDQIHPTAKGAGLARSNPVVGQGVSVAGYDGGERKLTWRVGKVVKIGLARNQAQPGDWFEMSRGSVSGDSGGPIFSDQGLLIGNLWGTSTTRTISLTAGRTRQFLSAVFPRLSAWGERTRHGDVICSGPDCQPIQRLAPGGVDVFETPVGPTPVQPIAPLAPIAAEKIDYAKLLDMMATDSRFKGPKGDRGEKGEAAQIDVMALAEAIKATLPPIHFNLIGPDGEVISSEAIPLGGEFNLHHIPK